jgi:hypothetical protein
MRLIRPRDLPPLAFELIALAFLVPLVWPRVQFRPHWGGDFFTWSTDFSWIVGLHLAQLQGLAWGRDVVFTYGPLGVFSKPLALSDGLSALGLLFVAASIFLLLASVRFALADRTSPGVALATCIPLGILLGRYVDELAACAALLFGGAMIQRRIAPRVERWVPILGGALAATVLLVKVSTGLVVGLILGVVILAGTPGRRGRRMAAAGLAFSVFLLAWWTLLGQSWGDLPRWLRSAASTVTGYSEAMAIESEDALWHYGAALLLVAALALAVLLGAERSVPRQRLAIATLLAAAGASAFKSGFVRHDPEHAIIFFDFLLAATLVPRYRPSWRAAGVGLAVAAATLAAAVDRRPLADLLDVPAKVEELGVQIGTLAASDTDSFRERSRDVLRSSIALPAGIQAALHGRSVHVDPDEAAIAWAYGLAWKPVPVFQSYVAYTPHLDGLNARHLAEPAAPERILRRTSATPGGRFRLWEAPGYALERLCRYRQTAAEGPWQVLARGPSRCGDERPLGTAVARRGEPVAVPAPREPGSVVVAHLDASPTLRERIRVLVFRPARPLQAAIDGRRYGLVRANLGGPLIVRVPPSSGWAARFDGNLQIDSFAIEGAERPIPVTFGEIPFESPGASAARFR